MADFNRLKQYCEIDTEKQILLMDAAPKTQLRMTELSSNLETIVFSEMEEACDIAEPVFYVQGVEPTKYCPVCGREFGEKHIHCPDCLVMLKNIKDKADVRSIASKPEFKCSGSRDLNDFDELLSDENSVMINEFDFTIEDFEKIIRKIKAQSFKNLTSLVNDNGIDLDELEILDKVILYAKTFVEVDFKSYGATLGYFEYDKIYIDDRQRKSLQITTAIHELTHFLVKEMLEQSLCRILDTTKNSVTDVFITYVLSHSPVNRLVDEYAAHTVEGRFTIFGYQDYSSFVSLQGDLEEDHVEIAKMIGNTFANYVKDILESFLDWDMREEIKEQFLEDTTESPDYRQLAFESCNKLSDEGLLQAIQLILSEGFINPDFELLERYKNEFID